MPTTPASQKLHPYHDSPSLLGSYAAYSHAGLLKGRSHGPRLGSGTPPEEMPAGQMLPEAFGKRTGKYTE
jgi:hypothetical protein